LKKTEPNSLSFDKKYVSLPTLKKTEAGIMNEAQRINLDDYIQTGEGGTAVAYTHKNGTARPGSRHHAEKTL